MAKYKVGDKVRIVSKNPNAIGFTDEMEEYLGKTLTVIKVWERSYGHPTYNFKEAAVGNPSMYLPRKVFHWSFSESWISGLAEPEREPCTVELRFDGMITTATLKRDGRDVKTAEARCNPKDTYSRAEGARVAVERLFEKKRKEDKPKESKPKMKSWWHGHTSAKPTGQSSQALSGLTLRQSTPFPIRGASASRPKRLTIGFCPW